MADGQTGGTATTPAPVSGTPEKQAAPLKPTAEAATPPATPAPKRSLLDEFVGELSADESAALAQMRAADAEAERMAAQKTGPEGEPEPATAEAEPGTEDPPPAETEIPEEQPGEDDPAEAGDDPQEEAPEDPDADGEDEEEEPGEEPEGEDEAPKGKAPKWAQKRIDKLVAQRNEARDKLASLEPEVATLRERVTELETRPVALTPTPDNPLADTRTPDEVQQVLRQAELVRRTMLDMPEGGTIQEGGKELELSAADVARRKAFAEDILWRHGPERMRWLQEARNAAEEARRVYPEAYQRGHWMAAEMERLVQESPEYARKASHHLDLGDQILGKAIRVSGAKVVWPKADAAGNGSAQGAATRKAATTATTDSPSTKAAAAPAGKPAAAANPPAPKKPTAPPPKAVAARQGQASGADRKEALRQRYLETGDERYLDEALAISVG